MAPSFDLAIAVVAYMVCSSSALIVISRTIHHFPFPGGVFCVQILFTVLVVLLGRRLRLIEADALVWNNVKRFALYVASFVLCLYSGGKALQATSVETVAVANAASPLVVCVFEWLLLGHDRPTARSALALLGVLLGSVGYVVTDSEFVAKGVSAYGWVLFNLAAIVFERVWGKRLISTVQFASPVWGSVLYASVLSLVPMALLACASGETRDLRRADQSPQACA